MLTALHIQDYVLIDHARLSLGPGLTALTGETGAGKSILLDALGLALGARAERGAVRTGASQGSVSAIFEPPGSHPVWSLLDENALSGEDDQIILRRTISAEGRGRGFINDQPVSVAMLREVGEMLMEIHGQHDGRGFLSASAHRAMLDEFGGLSDKAAELRLLWREWVDLKEALAEKKRERDATAREADYLRHVAATLEKLDPQPEEELELAGKRVRLMASEKIAADLAAAAAALGDRIENNLSVALRNVEKAAARIVDGDSSSNENALDQTASHLDKALNETAEAEDALARAIAAFGGDPDELDAVEERLFALRGEARKHGIAPDQLCSFLEKTKAALDAVELGEAAFVDLERDVVLASGAFDKAALALSANRRKAATALDKAVKNELAPLKLGMASFHTDIVVNAEAPTSDGYDTVEFQVATNPGAPAGPLKTIASGGELSRFVLAMKAALAVKENRTVIIFDEVDAGVGGAVADAVGERLARLALDAQVLVITHSPQVAARAHCHWRIEKNQTKKSTTTAITTLSKGDRVEEIARMLSGASISDEARAAAGQLLGEAPDKKRKRAKAS